VLYEHVAIPLMDILRDYNDTVISPKVHRMTLWVVYHMQTLMIDSLSSVSSEEELLAYRAHLAELDASLVNETRRRSNDNLLDGSPQMRMLADGAAESNSSSASSHVEGNERELNDQMLSKTSNAQLTPSTSSAQSFAFSLLTSAMARFSTVVASRYCQIISIGIAAVLCACFA
jgi:hypothetical protein